MKTISFIIPVYNEEEALPHFLDSLFLPVVSRIKNYHSEIIIVNDGSSDKTLEILHHYAKRNDNIKVISFSRNFGKEAALSAGFKYAQGDAVMAIDADGQQPPRLIPEFIKKWEQGAEIVTGIRSKYTKHGFVAKAGSKMFYKILGAMGNNSRMIPGATDYRLLDRMVVDEYNKLTEHNRISRGLIDWIGFRQEYIECTCDARIAGKPSYTFKKLFNLAIDSFVSLSTTPLVIFGYIGATITIGSFLLGVFVIIQQHLMGDPLGLQWNGAVQMSIFITFLVGLILISQAITALYISHIHAETQNRPLYIIDRKNSKKIK